MHERLKGRQILSMTHRPPVLVLSPSPMSRYLPEALTLNSALRTRYDSLGPFAACPLLGQGMRDVLSESGRFDARIDALLSDRVIASLSATREKCSS
jgi:hypothetical protein